MATMKPKEKSALVATLEARFQAHPARHRKLTWAQVQARLDAHAAALDALKAMEDTGGEPDVVGHDAGTGEVLFFDCATETPAGRRSLCYDKQALDARKENKPAGSAVQSAADMGITLLDEAAYRHLQTLGEFDLKTSSWILTPPAIRQRGGALFCDRRYGQVFTYHNGVQSYYAARGFRGQLRV
ncbi:DUF4256 domain-containing protein [Arenimonas sp. MALMAid1274]|uniref:DUF4256 domain-containing protein n=1 Tax=Arenimonas sp. MALMAid1274 TaxID=3411630 RepID=UPI003BA3A2A6